MAHLLRQRSLYVVHLDLNFVNVWLFLKAIVRSQYLVIEQEKENLDDSEVTI